MQKSIRLGEESRVDRRVTRVDDVGKMHEYRSEESGRGGTENMRSDKGGWNCWDVGRRNAYRRGSGHGYKVI